MNKLAIGLLLVIAATGSSACERTMAQERITLPIGSLPFASTIEGGWETSGWFDSRSAPETWIAFGPATTLEIHHPLGRVPASVEGYVTVDRVVEDQTMPEDFGAGAAPAAGDLLRIVDVNAMWVEVRNDGPAAQRLRLVLR